MDAPSLVLCKSPHHGNTAKVAQAICGAIGCGFSDPDTTPPETAARCGLLGIGSGVYYGWMHPSLFAWLRRLPDASSPSTPAFIYSTSGLSCLADFWHRPVRLPKNY